MTFKTLKMHYKKKKTSLKRIDDLKNGKDSFWAWIY